MKTATIYGLLDPGTHLVMYVGQTGELDARYRTHCSGRERCTKPWVNALKAVGERPVLVVLETVTLEREMSHHDPAALAAETKWIKRFRRTLLNKQMRENCPTTWDFLVNAEER